MGATIVPLVFAGGMDQNNNTIVGPPGIQYLDRARFVEPGKIRISPGYFRDTDFDTLNAGRWREISRVDDLTVLISTSSNGNYLYSSVRGSNATAATKRRALSMPAFEAPIRVDVSLPSQGSSTSVPVSSKCRSFSMALGGPFWLLIQNVYDPNGLYRTFYTVCDGDRQLATREHTASISGYCDACGVTPNTANGNQLFWYRKGNYLVVATYDITNDIWTNVFDSTGSGVSTGAWIKDVSISSYSGSTYVAAVGGNDHTFVWNLTTGSFVRDINTTAASTNVAGIVAYNGQLARTTVDGRLRFFDLISGSALCNDTYSPAIPSNNGFIGTVSQTVYASGSDFYCMIVHTYVEPSTGFRVTSIASGKTGSPNVQWSTYKKVYGYSVAGRPFISGSRWFVPLSVEATVSRSLVVGFWFDEYDSSGGTLFAPVAIAAHGEMPAVSQLEQGVATAASIQFGSPGIVHIPDPITGIGKNHFAIPFSTIQSGNLASGMTPKLRASAILCAPDQASFSPPITFDGLHPVQVGKGKVAVPAAMPWIDGVQPVISGWPLDLPPLVIGSGYPGSVFPTGAVYTYCYVIEWRDAQGDLYRSAPSQPQQYTVLYDSASINVIAPFTRRMAPDTPGFIRIYRSLANGTVLYDTNLTIDLNLDATGLQDQDGASDIQIAQNPILYTQSQNALGGLKPKYSIPPCRFGARGKDRLLVAGLERPNRVRWSLTFYSGEGVAFPHAQEPGWFLDFPCDRITAVWFLDDTWVVFSREKIWLVYGPGPDDNGLNGQFEPPRLICTNMGALSWRSLVEIPEGLVFQAPDSQLYLLVRGQYQVQWFSSPVKDELFLGLVGNRILNPIVGAVYNSSANTVHFFRAPDQTATVQSPVIVYDTRLKSWSLDSDTSEGLNGCISAGQVAVSDNGYLMHYSVASITPTYITTEAYGTVVGGSPGGVSPWYGVIGTNDFGLFGFGGWGRIPIVGIITNETENTDIGWQVWRNRSQGPADESGTVTLKDASAYEQYPQLSFSLSESKMSAMRVWLTISDRTTEPAGLIFTAETSERAERTAANRRA